MQKSMLTDLFLSFVLSFQPLVVISSICVKKQLFSFKLYVVHLKSQIHDTCEHIAIAVLLGLGNEATWLR